MDNLGPLENTSVSEDPILNDIEKNTYNWSYSDSSNVDHLVGVRDIQNLNVDENFLVLGRDNKKDGYSIYFDIKNQVFRIDNNHSFSSELENKFSSYWNSSYLNKGSRSDDSHYDYSMYDTKYSDANLMITWSRKPHAKTCFFKFLCPSSCDWPNWHLLWVVGMITLGVGLIRII